jgi:hypothetical protein
MSCWVVPTIAAELWGVSLDHVLGRIGEGTVRAKSEHGFVLVDVAPYGEVFHGPHWSGPRPRIQTFTVLMPDEYDALYGGVAVAAEDDDRSSPGPGEEPNHHEIQEVREEVSEVVEDPELGPDPNDEPDDGKPLRWREGRNRAAMMRRRPPG